MIGAEILQKRQIHHSQRQTHEEEEHEEEEHVMNANMQMTEEMNEARERMQVI